MHLLRPLPPYDLAKVWEHLADTEGAAPSAQKRVLLRTWMHDGAPIAVRLEDVGTVNAPALECELLIGDEATWPAIDAHLRRMLSLDVDLAPLISLAADDPAFLGLLQHTRGFRMVALPTPFEAAVWAVLKQNTFPTIARANWRKLQGAFGVEVQVDGRALPCFPDAATFLKRATPARLRSLKLRRSHIEYLRNAAELFAHELADPAAFAMEPDEIRALLAAVPGFGPWSVQFVSIRGFGHHDGLTVVAPSVRAKASQLYSRTLSARDIRGILARYEQFSGFWSHMVRTYCRAYAMNGR